MQNTVAKKNMKFEIFSDPHLLVYSDPGPFFSPSELGGGGVYILAYF